MFKSFIFFLFFSFTISTSCYSYSYIQIAKDSTIKTSADSVKTTLLKKFIAAISIKKNLADKQKKKIIGAIKEILEKDSIGSTIGQLKKLSEAITQKEMTHYTELSAAMESLAAENATIKQSIADLSANVDAAACVDCNTEMNSKEIDNLVDKMLPLISEKVKDEEAGEELHKKLKLIRNLILHPAGISDTLILNDSVTRTYTLKLKRRGEVFGHHPYWMNNKYPDYNFNLLTYVSYYGYELNGRTGGYKSINGWDTAAVVPIAKKAGCKVLLSVYCSGAEEREAFLKNDNAQLLFSSTIIRVLKSRNADGVNFMFDAFDEADRKRVTKFLTLFAKELKNEDPGYKVTVTLPVVDKNSNYDIKQLEPFVDYFIIDFSRKNDYGPLAPLNGSEFSLESAIAGYLNKLVAPEKFIACLPYRGGLWDAETKKFAEYIPYKKIVKSYLKDYSKVYDHSSVRIDVLVDEDTVQQLWYDDAKTFSEKYENVLKNNLGGVAIWTMGDDENNVDLNNALTDKMLGFDTTNIVEITKPSPVKMVALDFWAKVKQELRLYKLLFNHPCSFGRHSENKEKLIADDYIGRITIVVLTILATVAFYTVAQRRSLGDDWKLRKTFLVILVILVILSMFCLLLFFFLNPDFSSFGVNKDKDCETSFGIILAVLSIGFLIGLLAMRLLVVPLLKPKEIP